jgi:hypothetical protein
VQLNYNALDPKSKDAATYNNVLARRAQQLFRIDVDRRIGDASFGLFNSDQLCTHHNTNSKTIIDSVTILI